MGLAGLWFMGEPEQAKKKVLIKELQELYKTDEKTILKGIDLIEREVKKYNLSK